MKVEVVKNDQQMEDAFSVRKKVFILEQKVTEEEEIDEFESESIHFVLYNDDHKTIGAARLRFVEDYGKVERVCVLKEYRGTGAGKQLMQGLERTAADKNCRKFVLYAQTHAENFYKSLGYHTYSDIFMDAGIPHVAMKKEI
ncbi:GNAT family N-acetyltransferase [Alkalihalobacillus sp. TS-13]|uniref:GNAT family N-acetyltransferase n=1 Tax=Alkalihalobacillus sp. TS-13 TaxID=2842455 RepID=UPI001C87EB09|nr:GNAT family N-acetyltransferase [Alkalihalobacillus sp. TS-13]